MNVTKDTVVVIQTQDGSLGIADIETWSMKYEMNMKDMIDRYQKAVDTNEFEIINEIIFVPYLG